MKLCVLSGLEIPKGQKTIEHYVPKSRAPKCIWNNPQNIFLAQKTLNFIKGNLLPCEFEEQKFDLTYHAMYNWHIRQAERNFLKQTLEHWEEWYHDPCKLCLLKCGGHEYE